ncbi:MAG TPA: hypothetical protein VI583_01605 [Cyclobacteriaceae bacterium]|nr:hypothetical protein [Cyclobacteriaceae bacterium]
MRTELFNSPAKTILLAGFIAGTLDILCAIIFLAKGNVAGTFRFIARGALGDAAYQGGFEMILLGAVFHYTIATSFATGYFFVSPLIPVLKKYKIIAGLFYGLFVWTFMRYITLPLSYNHPRPFAFENEWKQMLILMLAVGLPISFITSMYQKSPDS